MVGGDSAVPPESPLEHTPKSPLSLSAESVDNGDIVPQSTASIDPYCVDPSSLHLKPVTEEELDQIAFPCDEKFDIVDGLLVWNRMQGTTKHQRIPELHSELFHLDEEFRAANGKVQEIAAELKDEEEGKRVIDLILTKRSSPTSSQENPSPTRKRKETHAHCSTKKPAHMAAEFTSGNRNTDFYSKWKEYRRTGISFYFIFDLFERRRTGKSRAIVGSKDSFEGAHLSDNGDPDKAASSSSQSRVGMMYYKKVFSEGDVLKIGPYGDYKFTVKQWMSEEFLTRTISNRRQRNKEIMAKMARMEKELAGLKREVAKLRAELAQVTQENARELAQAKQENARELAQAKQENERQAKRISELEEEARRRGATPRQHGGPSTTRGSSIPKSQSNSSSPVKLPARKKSKQGSASRK